MSPFIMDVDFDISEEMISPATVNIRFHLQYFVMIISYSVVLNTFASSRESSTHFALPFTSCVGQCRTLHTTVSRRGLEDFFDLPENWGETTVKSGIKHKYLIHFLDRLH